LEDFAEPEPMASASEAVAAEEPAPSRESPAYPASGYPAASTPSPAAWAPEPVAEPSHAIPGMAGSHAHDPFEARGPGRQRESARARADAHARPGAPDMNTDELSTTSRRLTEDLLKAMGFEPRVSVHAEGNRVDVTVEVDRDDDLLNGRQGETRQALQ